MVLQVPYNTLELQMALYSITDADLPDDKLKSINTKLDGLKIKSKADMNKKISKYNGISVKDLMSSPNYQKLYEEYVFFTVSNMAELFKKDLGISDSQSWALVLAGLDLLGD